MAFPLLKPKTIYFQPRLDMCVSTSLKVVFDNQFSHIKLSVHKFNVWCKYEGKYGGGIPLEKLREYLTPKLEELNVIYNEKEEVNIDFLYKLREQGIFPLVIFHLKDYNKWKKKALTEIFNDDEPNYHILIVVDIDKNNEKIKLFDCLRDKFRKRETEGDNYDNMSFQDFYSYWTKDELIYPAIWLTKIEEKQKVDKEQKRLILKGG